EGPQVAALGQHRQMLADLDAGRARRDGAELAPVLRWPTRLHIESIVLRGPAGEEQEDDGLWPPLAGCMGKARAAQAGDVGHRQPERPDRPGLQERTAAHEWMVWAC